MTSVNKFLIMSGRTRLRLRIVLVVLFCWALCNNASSANDDDLEVEVVDESSETGPKSENDIEYVSPVPSGPVYFAENFDDVDVSKKRWVLSKAHKEQEDDVFKYHGEWDFQLPQKIIFGGDRSLVLKSKAKLAAISAKLDKKFDFNLKPLFVQYEVNFQNGMDCGGAYIKLLSHERNLALDKFNDKTPYTIMFGPDKCGNDYKLHFIFRHKNPLNGTFEEKHAKKPNSRLEENYSDKKPHLYLLKLFPDNTFQVLVDGALINSGSLLEDMSPPVNPPSEIEDVNDKKPADWDERETIPDITAKKPADWDEDAPKMIPDPDAVRPEGWLVDEQPTIPDKTAVKPDDWDDSMDGEWEPPFLTNPACENAPGCGPWITPEIPNPSYKGKWKAPTIPNPDYKGKWTPRKIHNPEYFDDKEPFKMTSIGAVGIEIWAMTDQVLFDNFMITDDEDVLADWTSATFDLKRKALDRDSEGVFSRILNYSNAHPWIWAVYVVVIGLPIILVVTFCCGSTQEKTLDDGIRKKTDEPEEDDLPEEPVAGSSKSFASKDDLEEVRNESDDEDDEEAGGDGDKSMTSESSDDDDDNVNAHSRLTNLGTGDNVQTPTENTRKRRVRRD